MGKRQGRLFGAALLGCFAFAAAVQGQIRTREPNAEYASRRARLRAGVDAPIVIFGYTGKENASEAYVFNQENNFYYLTGDNEEGAALLLVPDSAASKGWSGPKEILYMHPHDRFFEAWNGPRMAYDDADIHEKTGFAEVRNFERLAGDLRALAKDGYTSLYTLLAAQGETAGYPHLQNWRDWLDENDPNVQMRQIGQKIAALREVKSATEIALLQKAIDASVDAHLAAMKMMRPGLWEYQVAARMEAIHFAAGCEAEAYSPIVGAGFNSTVLHYDKIGAQIQDGDIVVLDVAGQYSGYAADITRTLPANGKFTGRQREIYDIVFGAQEAAMKAVKPGMTLGRGENGLFTIAYDYINSHGKDMHGGKLGQYFIHGLGHPIGLDVHDSQLPNMALAPGMVITIEPGIYIPEEKLGVRIEDDVLVTETGFKLLSERLPRTAEDVERMMAEGKGEKGAASGVQN
jgi:Xaa-Pro aminopeptidase